jgi:hypothetical protein
MPQLPPQLPTWRHLNNLQIGKYAEYYAKMEAVRAGCDVYTAEVDDKGIDFVFRKDNLHYYDAQVKSLRWPGTKYVFMPKGHFDLRDNLLLVLVLFEEGKWPSLFALQASNWVKPQGIFVDRDYVGLKSKPEYGLQLSAVTRSQLEYHKFTSVLQRLLGTSPTG